MTVVDANLLLYAYDPRACHHEATRAWLEAAPSGSALIRFAWLTLWAFHSKFSCNTTHDSHVHGALDDSKLLK